MNSLQTLARAVAVAGAALVIVGWVVGGFPSPDGTGAALLWLGVGIALLGEAAARLLDPRDRTPEGS